MPEPGAPPPPPPKFPTRPSGPVLALPRRNSSPVSSRAPFADPSVVGDGGRVIGGRAALQSAENLAELERSLKQMQLTLTERERLLGEGEAKLAERERDLAEIEALLIAREKLAAVAKRNGPAPAMTAQEKEALEQMRAALDKQQVTIQEAKQAMREREVFLEESETKLFSKVQAQQEKEIELEQREEDLRIRERQFREAMAAADPTAAAALKTEDAAAAKQHDEFNE